jgi:predicted metal-binding membrane protein
MPSPVGAALRRERLVTALALLLLTALAWLWLLRGAGMGMPPRAVLEPFPHAVPSMAMAPPAWSTAAFVLAASMWWVMMVAMMLPAAAPVILLSAAVSSREGPAAKARSGWFLAGYLAVWGAFALAAAGLQFALARSGALDQMTLGSGARWFSAAVLVAAGLYQLSPLKGACLSQCRNPGQFLSRHYRRGRSGALSMGARHGAFCVGCCWLLMALLFVGGVMNLAWIALLTLLVAAEKLLPGGRIVASATGIACLAWGVATALV